MTEIKIDREKVIEGLEEVVHDFAEEVEEWGRFTPDELRGGVTVDCDWFYSVLTKCKNALALLKAEEPRVLTLEEVKAAAGHDVWLELSGNYADDVLFAATIEGCGKKSLCTRNESFIYSAYGIRPYGWRCWTSRPTEGQRKAVAWE